MEERRILKIHFQKGVNDMGYDHVLALLLDCGTDDLSILDDMDVDWEDIIENCRANGNISLRGLMEDAFELTIAEFAEAVNEALPAIKERIAAYAATDDDGEGDLPPEIADVPEIYRYGYMDVENFSEPAKQDLKELEELVPENDFDFCFNYQARYIYLVDHSSLYSRIFRDELDEIERKMGICISNRECE